MDEFVGVYVSGDHAYAAGSASGLLVIDISDPANPTLAGSLATPANATALSVSGDYAYVTVLGVMGDNDYVVQYETASFGEMERAAVGKDPHVSLNRWNHLLYVPCQESDSVLILKRKDLGLVKTLSVPGAHGAGMSRNGLFFYTTNLPGGGTDAVYTIFTLFNIVIGDPADTPQAVPHNIALTPNGRKLYVTHSGPNDKVSVFTTKGFFNPIPNYSGEVTVGQNPFGLAFVP